MGTGMDCSISREARKGKGIRYCGGCANQVLLRVQGGGNISGLN